MDLYPSRLSTQRFSASHKLLASGNDCIPNVLLSCEDNVPVTLCMNYGLKEVDLTKNYVVFLGNQLLVMVTWCAFLDFLKH